MHRFRWLIAVLFVTLVAHAVEWPAARAGLFGRAVRQRCGPRRGLRLLGRFRHRRQSATIARPRKENGVVQLFDGKSLAGWRVVEKFVFEDHGQVEVKDGQLHLGQGAPATGISWTGKRFPVNYEISLEAQRVKGNDFFCGLTVPYQDSHLSLIIGGWGGGVVGISNVDDLSAAENETTTYHEFKQNRWYRLRLRVAESRIQAWIDDEEAVDLEVGDHKFSIWWEQEPIRPFGLATWNTGAVFRNIRMRKLSPQEVQSAAETSEAAR